MKSYTYTDKDHCIYNYTIRCLTKDAVLLTRPLWEEVFSEDSTSFIQYYYGVKATKNTTFVCYTSDNELVSMVHLTPYDMVVNHQIVPTYYIVGIATKENHRHHGLMASLLKEAFSYAKSQDIPFVFLMPANPAIYEPFHFSYIYSRPEYSVPDVISPTSDYINFFRNYDIIVTYIDQFSCTPQFKSTLCKLINFSNQELNSSYDFYVNRTFSYYETMIQELCSQKGGIFLFQKSNKILGYFFYAKEDHSTFVQELLFSQEFYKIIASNNVMSTYLPSVKKYCKPIIMAKNLSSADFNYVNYLGNKKGYINEIV